MIFDGAEVYEIAGTFIFNKLKNVFQNITFGLYREDELAVIKDLFGPEIERLKKNVVKTSRDCGINITIEFHLHTVSSLDVIAALHICPRESETIQQFT